MLRRSTLMVTIIIFATGMLFLGYLGWERYSARFPNLPSGRYLGHLRLESGARLPLFVERREGSDSYIFAVLREGWPVTTISIGTHVAEVAADIMPVLIQGSVVAGGPSVQFQLSGHARSEHEFRGNVHSAAGLRQGSWRLKLIPSDLVLITHQERIGTQELLLKTREISLARAKLAAVSQQVSQQKEEISRLDIFLLRDRSETTNVTEGKLQKAREQLATLTQRLKPKLAAARKLEAQLEVSQKIAPMGRLAFLSRDANEREVRWVDSISRGGNRVENRDLSEAVTKSLRILRLKELIQKEVERVTRVPEATPLP